MPDSILLKVIKGEKTSYPPVWFMRQAGRVLPSYLELRNKYTFWQLMRDPVLAAKVTLLPVNDLDVDAAILFSDILVIPYAMGMGLDFTDQGPVFEKPLKEYSDPLLKLKPDAGKLHYIYAAIDEIIKTRPSHIPLIGFAGAPFTVLCYMLEGLSSKTGFNDAVTFFYNNKATTRKLVEAVTDLTIEYACQQVYHGIDMFQLFETHGGLIPFEFYKSEFFPAVKKIARAVRAKGVPFVYFPKDIGTGLKDITPDACDIVSVDWQTSIYEARKLVHHDVGLQGNLDPRLLYAGEDVIESEIMKYLDFGKEEYKWIFNLGHGFLPGSSFEKAKFIVNKVKTMNWGRSHV